MSQASQKISQQFIDGGVIPADMAGQDATTKTYVDGQLSQRDTNISAAASAASAAQSSIDTHKADSAVHVTPSEKTKYNGHIADSAIHVTVSDKAAWNGHVVDQNIHVTAEKKNEWDSKAPGSTQTDLTAHTGNSTIHVTASDHIKLDGIQVGAEVNQNAFSKVNDVNASSKTDVITFQGGTGITVSTDPASKKLTITATGDATPGPHASSHITGGTDIIPNAVTGGASGLMSGADAQFVRVNGETKTGAQAKADAAKEGAINKASTDLAVHSEDNSKHVPHLGTTTNIDNAFSIDTNEIISVNQKFTVKFNAASTGTATLNVSTIGEAKSIKKSGGTDASVKIGVYTVFHDGSNFQLLGEGGGEYGTATAADVLAGKTIPTENGLVTGTIVNKANSNIQSSFNSNVPIPAGYYNGNGAVLRPDITAGDYLAVSSDTARADISSTYKLAKSITLRLAGVYRVSFTLKGNDNAVGWEAYGRLYKNGSPYGTERSLHTTLPTVFTQDLAFAAGDTCELWYRSNNGVTATVSNFRISTSNQPLGTVTKD